MTQPASATSALAALESLSQGQIDLSKLSDAHDMLRLLGVVMGHLALLKLATDPLADPRAKVSAARALLNLRESPESIAERLRRSPFSDLSVEQLETMVRELKPGQDLPSILAKAKKPSPTEAPCPPESLPVPPTSTASSPGSAVSITSSSSGKTT